MNKLLCPLAAIILAAMTPLAQAGLEINYQVGAGPVVTCGPVGTPTVSCTDVTGAGLFNITGLTAFSNSPGDTPSLETSATSTLSNRTASSETIVINVISTDFTIPTAPPVIDLLSHVGGSTPILVGANSISFISCVDQGNSQTGGCPATVNAPTITPGPLTNAGSYNGDSSTTIASLAAPFAVDEKITVTLAAGSTLNFSGSTTLVATPEPASIVLLGGALLFISSRLIRRRRKSIAQA